MRFGTQSGTYPGELKCQPGPKHSSAPPESRCSVEEHEKPKSSLRGASKSMHDSMSEKELKKIASTKRKGKPEQKRKSN